MRYVIHIGPRKTGSTYLQESLYALRPKLERDGICYPAGAFMLFPGATLHTRLFRMIRNEIPPEYEAEFRRLNAAGHKTVILSDEHFSEFNRDHIGLLRQAIGPAQFEIVFYNRCWSERLPSSWIEMVKAGSSTPYPEWLHGTLGQAETDKLVNSALTWRKWAEVFGRESLRLVSYDSLREKKIDIVEHFLREIVGWKGEIGQKRSGTANVSPPPIPTEICRALNYIDFCKHGRIVPGPRNEFISQVAAMDQARLDSVLGSEATTLRLADDSPLFAGVRAQMDRWADRVVPVGGERNMGSLKAKLFHYVRPNWAFKPEALPLLREIYDSIPLYKGVWGEARAAS
jgi:hypothetical protein